MGTSVSVYWRVWDPADAGRVLAAAAIVALSACGAAGSPSATSQGLPACSPAPQSVVEKPAPATTAIAEYKAPGLGGIWQVVTGPDGNLWFTGSTETGHEVIGRATPTGTFALRPLSTGAGFDGITVGPESSIWFTESTALKVGRLVPSTGAITEFPVSVPASSTSGEPTNMQVRDIVAGPDGALWFDVQQVASAKVMPTGYVGRVTTSGVITLFAVPNGDQPIGIQAGADGNLWSRITISDAAATACDGLPGYSPTSKVVRVTPGGDVTELDESSSAFAGYIVGPDASRWWMTSKGMLRRITSSGQVTEFATLSNLGFWDAFRFVFGPDGNVWYVNAANVVRLTISGIRTKYHAPGTNSGATWVATGPDGRVWFVEGFSGAATLGAIRPAST
jgi:virginiamycin B lyase